MKIRHIIRKWLGISELLDRSYILDDQLVQLSAALSQQVERVSLNAEKATVEVRQAREWMQTKFDSVLPASPEFFDEMRRQMEARMDQTMNACDRMADEMKRGKLYPTH